MIQLILLVTGAASIWLSQGPNAKWACVVGLASQPFWFYETYINQQWGIFALSFIYTVAWLRGIKTYWRKECITE